MTPEWLPEGPTNKGLVPVAADPPPAEDARRAAPAEPRAQAVVPLDHIERLLGERIAEIERRIESRLQAAVADMKRALEHGSDRPPTPDPLATPSEPSPSPRSERPLTRRSLPTGPFSGNGDEPALDGAVDSRLKEAERRIARAARATERNVDEVRRILGARLAAERWISGRQDGAIR